MLLAARDDRQVRRQEMIADAALIGEAALEAPFVQVIEEQPADAARLVAMFEKEIAIAPFLVLRYTSVAERLRTRLLRRAVPVQNVFVERIVGREIEAAAEPPRDRRRSRVAQKKRTFACVVGTYGLSG